ncbi:MAG: hypothetical protein KDK70_19205 [Myxococcales bacterium]|nr:hypothetical protein [Myxococcales bacterium]
MSKHAADILGITTPGALAGELVAAALEREDPQAAAIIRAQAQWLRRGDAASREAAEALVHAITDAEHPGRWRSQIYLGDVFSTPSTVLADDHEAHAWVYDDDVVSLPDRYSYDPRIHPTAWEASTTAEDALRAVLDAPRPQPLRSLRLLMFGGTAKPWAVLHERGAHQRVTHLSLRLQRECEESLAVEGARNLRELAAQPLPLLLLPVPLSLPLSVPVVPVSVVLPSAVSSSGGSVSTSGPP